MLQSYITGSYYGMILWNDIVELYYGIIFTQRITGMPGTSWSPHGVPGIPWARQDHRGRTWDARARPWDPQGRPWDARARPWDPRGRP